MPDDAIADCRARAMRALIPPPRMNLPEWIEATIRLPEGVSATPGLMRLTRVQRGIADALSDPGIERITVVKPVRLGYTSLLSAVIASYVANAPSPILAVLPTADDCRDYAVSDLEPIFDASPALRGMLADDADPAGRSTMLSRRFPGGSLKLVAAKSPRSLRRHNARILLLDEIDGMESGPEGDVLTLAERRTLSFADRKIVAGSTPVYADGPVLTLYAESDMREFQLRCVDCGHFHAPTWQDIDWPAARPRDARYVCPDCGSAIDERHKPQMVESGRWYVTRPEVAHHAGFRTNVLVSTLPNASWGRVAEEFLSAKERPDRLQTWTNTLMAQGWDASVGAALDPDDLRTRREAFDLDRIPPEVLVLSAGVDVQHNRLECVTIGHDRGSTAYVLDQRVFWGDVNQSDVPWQELDAYLTASHPHPHGGRLRLDATAIDSSDGATMDRVLAFCGPRLSRRVVAIKGAAGQRPAIVASKAQGRRLFIVGVDGLKRVLVERLAKGRTIHFSEGLEDRFFEELASERLIQRYHRGAPVRLWERIPGRLAESLDCVVYALAVHGLVRADLDARADQLAGKGAAPKPAVVARSKFLSGA